MIDLREGKHVGGIKWTVVPLYVEVGCRGSIYEGPWFGMRRRLLHKDHYSPSHTGGPGDSGDVQLLPLPVSFHESVGGESPDGKVHLDGHAMTRFTVGVNKIAGATVSVPA